MTSSRPQLNDSMTRHKKNPLARHAITCYTRFGFWFRKDSVAADRGTCLVGLVAQSRNVRFVRKSPIFNTQSEVRDALNVDKTLSVSLFHVLCRVFGDTSVEIWLRGTLFLSAGEFILVLTMAG